MEFTLFDDAGKIIGQAAANETIGRDVLARAGKILTIKAFVPFIDAAGYWHPDLKRLPLLELPWVIEFTCGANRSFPFWCLYSQSYRNCAAIGLSNHFDDCRVRAKMNQELGGYELTFDLSIDAATEPLVIYADETRRPFPEVVAEYRQRLAPETPVYPAGAWEPVYCTWYAVHTVLSAEYLETNARLARELGFGTFIVDDGWCLDENKRVTPATLPTWYDRIGDWELSQHKLPRMKETVKAAQATGLRYLFWVAPFFVGDRSALAQQTRNYLTESHEGQRLFDPADPEMARITMEKIVKIFADMELDGLKIDFIDIIMPDEKRPRSRAAFAYVAELVRRIRAIKKEALIEFRQNYGTPVMRGLATAFRAGDVPFDYVENFQRCIQLRLLLGDGVPVHADPIYFRPDEEPVNVARHMMASMAGVPMLSMDLRLQTEEQRQVVSNYLSVYRRNQDTLNFGHWEFGFSYGHTGWARCRRGTQTVLFVWEPEWLTRGLKDVEGEVTVLNLSADSLELPDATAFDATGTITPTALPGSRLELKK